MNKGRVIVTGIILSIIYIAMEYVTHRQILMDMYLQTATVWRTQEEMAQLCWLMCLAEVIFAFMFGIIFAAGYDRAKASLGQGFRYGFMMALLLAPVSALVWYVVLPIPGALAVGWFIATFVQMWVLGIVAGLVYKQ